MSIIHVLNVGVLFLPSVSTLSVLLALCCAEITSAGLRLGNYLPGTKLNSKDLCSVKVCKDWFTWRTTELHTELLGFIWTVIESCYVCVEEPEGSTDSMLDKVNIKRF